VNLSEGFRESFDMIRHNKLRTLLTMLGMNIGVAAVIAVMSTGLMGRSAIMSGIESMGSTLVWVRPNTTAYPSSQDVMYMKPEDADALSVLVAPAWTTPLLRGQFGLGYRGDQQVTTVYGVWSDYLRIWARNVGTGRFISMEDQTNLRRTVVLGPNTARALFATEEEALGKSLTLGGRDFTVVGVMGKKERSPIDDGSDDDTCFVPYGVEESMYNWSAYGGPRVLQIYFKARTVADLDELTSQVTQYLANRYGTYQGLDRFNVRRAEDNIQTTNKVFDIVTIVITLVAAISLLVGGIGIMNIMLVTVTERTKEIGVRKAIGAKRRDIMAQFMIEAIIICMIGGGIGIVLGIGLTAIVSVARGWAYLMPWISIVLGLSVSIAIGLFFGIYPAAKAARLDPVVALTKE
jgi:putative ABC transport system permease protein